MTDNPDLVDVADEAPRGKQRNVAGRVAATAEALTVELSRPVHEHTLMERVERLERVLTAIAVGYVSWMAGEESAAELIASCDQLLRDIDSVLTDDEADTGTERPKADTGTERPKADTDTLG